MPSLLLNKASSDAMNYAEHSAVSYVQEENECCCVQGVVQHKAFVRVQSGFTLIELMIALALGLVISAAAIMLFLTGQRSYVLQQGMADLQDNANFGLNYVTKDIRHANLNSPIAEVNDETAYSGVVLTSSVNAAVDSSVPPLPLSNLFRTIIGATANINLLSRSQGMAAGTAPAWTGVSNVQLGGVDILSDQLVTQYTPQYVLDDKGTVATADDTWFGGFDCEGGRLEFSLAVGRQVVVQRYFLRVDTNASANEPNQPLALACDAGRYAVSGDPTAITGYGDAGEIIMKRVDHLRVLLGIQNGINWRYVSVADYMGLATPRPRIMSMQLGILARSAQTVGADSAIANNQVFQVLDQAVTVKTPPAGTPKYVRQVVTQTVAMRNTFGERGRGK